MYNQGKVQLKQGPEKEDSYKIKFVIFLFFSHVSTNNSYRESWGRKMTWKHLETKQYFRYEIEIHFPYKNIVMFPMNFVIFSEFLDKYISLSIDALIKWKGMICQLLSNCGRKIFVISEPSDEMYAISVFHDCVLTWFFDFREPLFQSNSLLFMKNSEKTPYCHMRIEGFPNGNQ